MLVRFLLLAIITMGKSSTHEMVMHIVDIIVSIDKLVVEDKF